MIVGLDIGYSNVKIAWGAPGAATQTRIAPAGAGRLSAMSRSIGGGALLGNAVPVVIDGEDWAALADGREFDRHQRKLHADYASSKEYLALFLGALSVVNSADIALLVTGLPVDQAMDRKRSAELIARLQRSHTLADGRTVKVHRVVVWPQPAGAWMDALAEFPDLRKPVGTYLIYDPGFYSVDWMVLVDGRMRKAGSGSSQRATSEVLEETSIALKRLHGFRIPLERLEAALRSGQTSITVGSEEVDLSQPLREAANVVSSAVADRVQQELRSSEEDVTRIVLAGGGGSLFGQALHRAFPKAKVYTSKNPVLANARGFYLHAMESMRERAA